MKIYLKNMTKRQITFSTDEMDDSICVDISDTEVARLTEAQLEFHNAQARLVSLFTSKVEKT